ncbi:hypothetical protein NDU88_001794 [Pleurodeles waltl]|uniref:Uncharacterized protein n=1 Tax=Pleurodeles waltl TaxID=8319 RepID=A0AAV7LH26_PLEWA|nr:hypothetical protein NDU88_001794 [Pleurodeles waltl]
MGRGLISSNGGRGNVPLRRGLLIILKFYTPEGVRDDDASAGYEGEATKHGNDRLTPERWAAGGPPGAIEERPDGTLQRRRAYGTCR